MSNRHLIRSIVLQSLFEWDFKEKKDNIDDFINYDIEEFAPTLEKDDFLQFLIKGVTRNIKDIDKIIKAYAPEWPINQISVIDRNILRISIFELIYNDSTPYKVIINEAIELSKNFGSGNSSKFINGVLGTVFENLNKNITNIYEIGLVIKNKNKYLVNKQDDKISFIRFENEKKEEDEKEKIKEIQKEAEKAKAEVETENNKPLEKGEKIKEEVIESSDDRLDNNDFINNNEKEEKEKAVIEEEKKEKEKIYIDYSKKKIKDLLGNISYNIKSIGDVNYCVRKDNKELFPSITRKNIIFFLIDNIDSVNNIKESVGKWVEEREILDNIEYKNLKKILKNL